MPKVSRAGRRQDSQNGQEQQSSSNASIATAQAKPLHRSREMSTRTRIISLAFGDLLCFLIFVTLGADAHGEGFNPLYSLWLALPFAAAWFLVSPFLGAFRADVATRPKKMILRTMLCWLTAWPVAMLFRWLLVERVAVPPVSVGNFLSFSLVTLLFNLVLLSLFWRWPFALNNNLRSRGV